MNENLAYGYLLFGAWSEGSVLATTDEFRAYMIKTAQEYNIPLTVHCGDIERKQNKQCEYSQVHQIGLNGNE